MPSDLDKLGVSMLDLPASARDRNTFVGGSDFTDILNVAPYGCQRRLWFEKRGQSEPKQPTGAMLRGTFGEDAAVAEYERQTGRKVRRRQFVREGYYGVHIDRHIVGFDGRGPGVLEVKCPGEFPFKRIKRDGLHEGYIAQLQWGLARTGWRWGSFAVMHLDSWQLLWWDVPRDNDLISVIGREADLFWQKVENGPMPEALSHTDRRCGKCQHFTTCHPDDLPAYSGDITRDDGIAPLIAEYMEAKAIFDDAEAFYDSVKDKVKGALGDRQVVDTIGARIYFATQDRKGYTVAPGQSRPLRVFPK